MLKSVSEKKHHNNEVKQKNKTKTRVGDHIPRACTQVACITILKGGTLDNVSTMFKINFIEQPDLAVLMAVSGPDPRTAVPRPAFLPRELRSTQVSAEGQMPPLPTSHQIFDVGNYGN